VNHCHVSGEKKDSSLEGKKVWGSGDSRDEAFKGRRGRRRTKEYRVGELSEGNVYRKVRTRPKEGAGTTSKIKTSERKGGK